MESIGSQYLADRAARERACGHAGAVLTCNRCNAGKGTQWIW